MTVQNSIGTDLYACEKELIHIPGAIQPHGYFIAFQKTDLRVHSISANVEDLLKQPADKILAHTLQEVLPAAQASLVQAALSRPDPHEANPLPLTLSGQRLDGILRLQNNLVFLELETPQPDATSDTYSLAGTFERLQKARTLDALLDVTVKEIRALTQFDRVVIYRFDDEGDGQVIAEARDKEMDPYLGLYFPATDIPAQARTLYTRSKIRSIPEARYIPVPLLSSEPEALDLTMSILRSVSPMHREYINHQGLRASMSVSLMQGDNLWGLISCGHRAPHYLSYRTRSICHSIGELLSLQITALLDNEAQHQRESKRSLLTCLAKAMRQENSGVLEGLAREEKALLEIADATGAAILVDNRIITVGKCPSETDIQGLDTWVSSRLNYKGMFHTRCLPAEYPSMADHAAASGLLVLSLPRPTTNRVFWFRPELIQTINWSGNPHKPLEIDPSTGQLRPHPRRSFALWQERVRGRSQRWRAGELYAVCDLRRYAIEIDLARQVVREREAVRARDEIVGIVSHDLRNPMTIVMMQAGVMQRVLAGDQRESSRRLSSSLQIIQSATARMSSLIGDLLDTSKIEAGRFQVTLQPQEAAPLVQQAILLQNSLAESKCISLIERAESGLIVQADAERLFQVLSNLIGNAIKFTSNGGNIEVVVQLRERDVLFEIRDTGIGIPPDVLPHIFDRYWHTGEGNPTGSGLGLFISKGIIEAHGGRIWANSQQGQGSTFAFTLPLLRAEEP
ncbi:light-regulated signal transduction histidine kinase (bacteriophytochrome) [Pseudomonas duriflava]|uniref:histidine kinase n=1 Tax=Pseudomonas duriflava TaxID=459528 RepID=A0A562PPD9_9PSED|nr:ATP-binding protein [Pseudomonas duriflava]TWI46312.1 light-regulated signal transduction histidine kinase (bacteriophytochrome) [Pseudomonas duriflava]